MLINKDCVYIKDYQEIPHKFEGKVFGLTTILNCEVKGEIAECPSCCPYGRFKKIEEINVSEVK